MNLSHSVRSRSLFRRSGFRSFECWMRMCVVGGRLTFLLQMLGLQTPAAACSWIFLPSLFAQLLCCGSDQVGSVAEESSSLSFCSSLFLSVLERFSGFEPKLYIQVTLQLVCSRHKHTCHSHVGHTSALRHKTCSGCHT